MIKQEIRKKCQEMMKITVVSDSSRGYGTTRTGYGTTSVWCGGGSRNVEGCWGFPYFKIQKLQIFHFMFFDRYEVHIHDFGDFI